MNRSTSRLTRHAQGAPYDEAMDATRSLTAVDGWLRERPWIVDTVLAALVAALVLPTSGSAVLRGELGSAWAGIGFGALLAAHVSMAVRRLAPRAVFGLVCFAMLVLLLLPDLAGAVAGEYDGALPPILLPSSLVFPWAVYTLALHASPRTSLLGLGLSGVGAALAMGRLATSDLVSTAGGERGVPGPWLLILLLVLVGCTLAPWSLGRFRRVNADYVRSLEERTRLEQQERDRLAQATLRDERSRIAREMHDVVSHSLAVMVSQAEGGRMMAAKDPTVAPPVLETVARTGQEAMRGMRGLLDALDPDGAVDAPPQPRLADLAELLDRTREAGLPLRVQVSRDPDDREDRLDSGAELAAYRLVQEALTNVLKHAPAAGQVTVEQQWQDVALRLRVRNDAAGHGSRVLSGQGRGIPGMRQRVELVGGAVSVGHDGEGWFEVSATIPRRRAT